MGDPTWVMDTSVFTHFHRAGHGDILRRVAPKGELILIPDAVNKEIEEGREWYPGIPSIQECPWVKLCILDKDESAVKVRVQDELGAETPDEHAGEAAVIAYAAPRGYTAVIDEREARTEAEDAGITVLRDSLWIVIEAYHTLDDVTRACAERIVDDLIATEMRLPIREGASLIAWAYHAGYMPHPELPKPE